MPGRNESEAWRAFRDPVQQAVGCVDVAARLGEKRFRDQVRIITSTADGVRLTDRLRLVFTLQLRSVEMGDGQWRMSTRKYDYNIMQAKQLLFGWHWHPASKRSPVKYPHLHVPSSLAYSTKHIVTGRVALEDVLKFAMVELGAQPSDATASARLDEISERHKTHRSWS